MRTLERLHIPTVLFVNKVDRSGADVDRVASEIATALTAAALPMGSVHAAGTRAAAFAPYAMRHQGFSAQLGELLADHSEAMLATYVEGRHLAAPSAVWDELARQTRGSLVHPAYFGSAITGAGVGSLIAGVTQFLTGPEPATDGPAAGTVLKAGG